MAHRLAAPCAVRLARPRVRQRAAARHCLPRPGRRAGRHRASSSRTAACSSCGGSGRWCRFVVGLLVGTAYGAVDGAFLTAPYLIPGNTAVGSRHVRAGHRDGRSARSWPCGGCGGAAPSCGNPPKRWLVRAVAALPFVVVAAFLLRPYVERGWRTDYYHGYAPLSLHWIYWYTGVTTIAFAVIAIAMLGRRCVKGEAPVWVLPLLVFAWAIVCVPAPARDHPAPAVCQPPPGSRRAARPDPARGVAGRLAGPEVAGAAPGGRARLPEADAAASS